MDEKVKGVRSKTIERHNVEFPLWRKKVDNTIFRSAGTTVPKWAANMWALDEIYPHPIGRKDPASEVGFEFEGYTYNGWVTCTHTKNRKSKVFRIFFSEELRRILEETFLMSYMRDLEARLRKSVGDIETEIPFWEFIDIEFDSHFRKFYFTAHYVQTPTFPNLFRRLISSPIVKSIHDEVFGKGEFQINKQDWKLREEFETELGARNVIYMLVDLNDQLFYVGESDDLIKRFRQGHPSISGWTHYRYDVLPANAAPIREALERMIIRGFATLMPNQRDIPKLPICRFKLMNERVDG